MDITTPGLNTTSCNLVGNVGAAPAGNVGAFVSDTSPASEARYRARWYFDVSQLTLTSGNFQTRIFNAFANTAPGTFNTDEVRVSLVGGATPTLRFLVADATQPSGFKTITAPAPGITGNVNGHYYVEIDLNKGTGAGAVAGATCNTCAAGDAGGTA